MLNFSEGFPIIPETPSAGPLRLNAYSPGQVLAAYDGDDLEFLDPSQLTNPLAYTRGDIKKVETYNQYYALTQALGALEGNLTGVSDGILGIANDPTKGAAWRQLIGKAPLTPIRYGDSELTQEAIDADLKSLNMMLEAEEGVDFSTLSYDQLSDRQKQIRDLSAKITYAEARNKATEKLGFDWIDQMMAQDVFGLTGYLADKELAGDTQDIEKLMNREDPNFDYKSWFGTKFSNEIVSQYLVENGITDDFISDSPNADHAMMRIMAQLNTSDIQRRMETYKPTTLDSFRLLRDGFIGGMINSPDTIPSVVAELGLVGISTLAGSLLAPGAGTVAGAAAGVAAAEGISTALGASSVFMRLKKAYDASTFAGRALRATAYTTETLYKLPLGMMPGYVANFGLIRGAAASFTFGAVQGGLAEYARQKREIAFGAATLYANPNAMTDYNASLMATTALESGVLFGGVFGLGGGLLRSGIGAFQNRVKGVMIDPKTGFRNIADTRFTFENTPLGNTIDNIRGFVNRKERALIDAPVTEKAAVESVIENTEVTPEKLAADTEARVDRVETREATASPDAARATPEDAGTRRYEGETIPEYVARVGPNRAVRNIYEIVTEVARRTKAEGSERLIEASEQFDQMSIQDQMRVLFNTKKVLDDAKKAETDAVGLPKERERLYDELEKSRKAWFARLKKKLPKEAFKALKEELEENKKASGRKLPELLKEARDTAKPAAERKAASDEMAAKLLESISAAAASPEREAQIKAQVPPEVIDTVDAAIVEHKLTGTVSDATAETLKADIAGVKKQPKVGPVDRMLNAISKSIIAAKIDPNRVKKIKAVIRDPDSFVSLVDGDKDNATRFFDYLNELVINNIISSADKQLVLASVVHLNFSSKAFGINFKVESILDKAGNKQEDLIGSFRRSNNSLIMNLDFAGTTNDLKRRRAKALLHELGHAYFAHEASGDNYLSALRLYNKTIISSGIELMRYRPDTPDPLLNSGFLSQYHMQNAEEVFVQTFSQILFSEAEAVIGTWSPMQVSRTKFVLDKIATSVALAATLFDSSEHYAAAKEIIDSITDIDNKTKSFISMPTLAKAYGNLHSMLDSVDDLAEYNKKLDTEFPDRDMKPYHLNKAELTLFKNSSKDPGFIIAMTIMKADQKSFVDANGNFTRGINDLVKAYKEYKLAQLTSMQIKVAFLVGSNDYKVLKGLDKFDRLDFVKDELFSLYSREFVNGKSKRTILPATYEDLDALRNLDTMDYLNPTGSSVPYAVGFFGTTGDILIDAIESVVPTGKALASDTLSAEQVSALVGSLRVDDALTTNLIDQLRVYLDNIGLEELADVVTEAQHLAYIQELKNEGMLDVKETVFETPEFKAWFKDSKVVDAEGKPLIVYHGTSKDRDFNKFKVSKRGSWFTSDPKVASEYAMQNDSQKIVTEWDETKGRPVGREINTASRVIPVFLSIQNPAKFTPEELEGFRFAPNYEKYQADLFEKYRQLGHDGVDIGQGVWVVFDATKIKSTYNRGTFDPTNADIRREVVEPTRATPEWPNKQIAATSLALMLKEKLSVDQIKVILKNNLSSSMYTYLINNHKTPKKLIGAVSKLLEEDGIVLNEDSKTWGIRTSKPATKVTAAAQEAAVSFESTALTKDNLVDVVSRIIKQSMRGNVTDNYFVDAAGSMITPKPDAKTVGKKAYAGNLELILSKIENGSLKTVKDLIGYIHTTAFNLKKADVAERESLETPDGVERTVVEGRPATAADRIVTTKKGIRKTILTEALDLNTATNGRLLTAEETELVNVFTTAPTNKEAGVKLGVSESTAGRYRRTLIAKLVDIFEQSAISLDSGRDQIVSGLNKHFDTVEKKVNAAKPNSEEAVIKKAAEKKPKPEADPVVSGARALQTAALAEKLRNKNPEAVIVPLPKDAEGVMYKVTDEVTGNEPEKVFRPSEQADAVMHGSPTASKEAVSFVPKKPLPMNYGTSTDLTSQPKKLESTLKSASRLGVDALVFKDGSVIPVNIEELPVIGKTEVKKEPDAEPEVTLTVENKKPVLSVISKERKPTEPKPKKENFPVKVEKVRTQKAKAESKKTSVKIPKTPKERIKDGEFAGIDQDKAIKTAQSESKTETEKLNKLVDEAPVGTQFIDSSNDKQVWVKTKAGWQVKDSTGRVVSLSSNPIGSRFDGKTFEIIYPEVTTTKQTKRIPMPPKKEVPVEKTPSDQVKTPEVDVVERKVNEDPKLLRQSGMDSNFLKTFIKKYWESKVEADGRNTMTPMFKKMWSHFVNVNQYIADANKRILGDDIMDKFWTAVDRIRAESLRLKVTEGPQGKKPLSYRQILEQAAKEVQVEGKPEFVIPLLPDEVKFVKENEAGDYRLSARSKKAKEIINAAGEDPVIPPPPSADAIVRAGEGQPEVPVVAEPEPPTPKEKLIGQGINQSEGGASRLLRLNNLVGWIFGGNQRENRTWFENLMNKGSNATQSATQLGNTLRSQVDMLSFVSRFFDDTKTQTGHLVGAGKTAFRTAMQLRAEEGRLMTRIFREYAKVHNLVPRLTSDVRSALDMYIYESLFKNRQPNKADLVALGIPAYQADAVAKQASLVIKSAQIANRNILELEAQTGRMSIVDENGNPVSPKTYAPVQLDHEGLARLDQNSRSALIKAMVAARTNRKLNDPMLDINTMIVMGWLDVAFDEDAKTLNVFATDRTIKYSEASNMFSNETLLKLFDAEIKKEGITGRKSDLLKLLRKSNPEKYFVLEFDDKYVIYRIPEKVTDLAPADKAKYMEAVKGNTAMYTEKWRKQLNNQNLIEREMKEILKYKTKQYPYNNPDDFNSVTKQPFFKIDPEGKTVLPIRGLTPEELLAAPETRAVLRTNLAESYFYFLKGRHFELAFQRELDRMFGQTGITILDVFDYVEKTGYENFEKIAELANWTPQELSTAQKGLADGLKRLREEYQFNADTLPYLNSEVGHSARIGLAAIRFKFSAGYGISAFTETLAELAKQSPEFYSIPKNIVNALRYVLADYRFSKQKLLESDIGDMTFVLENFRTDLANRFMGEIGYGSFRTDSRLGTKVANSMLNIRDAQGGLETATRTFEEAGKWMQSIGSLQAVTNGTRALAKQRIQRMIWKHIQKGNIERLFDVLQESTTADELAQLKKAAATDSRAEASLWKKFAGLARHQAKFGDANEAALFLKYGLTTKEQIVHLKWAMEKAGHRDGRINIFNLEDIHEDLLDNPVDGFSPDILKSAISAYAHMVEDLIIKTSTSELKGLNKITSLDSRSALGRMWYALTSWVRSYQDNVILDFGSRSTVKYLASGIFLYAALDTIVGLFKEWLAGRETEDMLKELEEQPGQYVLRGVSRVPFLGIANGLVESGVSTISGLTGGTYKYYGIPLMPAGAGAGMGAIETDYRNMTKIVEDPLSARSLKAASDLFGATSLVNRSPVAIPVRLLEDMNTFKEMDAIQKYLDMVQRDPYPYSKKAAGKFKPIELDYETTPRNYALEQQMATQAMQREMARRPMPQPESPNTFPMVNDQKGVSERLGELLD